MKIYNLYRKQFVPIDLVQAWDFFSNPMNLNKITPKEMGFVVTSLLPDKMFAGLIVTYTIKPLLRIPVSWVTEITHVEALQYFVDEQRFGPYKFWHHRHTFKSVEGGVEMEDIVNYGLPFGFIGRIVNSLIVKAQLRRIFDYRNRVLIDLFN